MESSWIEITNLPTELRKKVKRCLKHSRNVETSSWEAKNEIWVPAIGIPDNNEELFEKNSNSIEKTKLHLITNIHIKESKQILYMFWM